MTALFIIAGLAVIVAAAFWLQFLENLDLNMIALEFLGIIWFMVMLFAGVCLIIYPFVKDQPDEAAKLHACEAAGGKYIVIQQEWNGKQYINVYGCTK